MLLWLGRASIVSVRLHYRCKQMKVDHLEQQVGCACSCIFSTCGAAAAANCGADVRHRGRPNRRVGPYQPPSCTAGEVKLLRFCMMINPTGMSMHWHTQSIVWPQMAYVPLVVTTPPP